MQRTLYNIISDFFVNRSIKSPQSSPLHDLSLWGLERNTDGQITVSGIAASSLIKKYGSFLLVVNLNLLIADARSIQVQSANPAMDQKLFILTMLTVFPGFSK